MNHQSAQDRLDQATSARLAKLARCHVDTSRLEQSLKLTMSLVMEDAPAATTSPTTPRSSDALRMLCQRWWRPLSTSAAAILIALTIGWLVLGNNTSQAMAAPADLAQIHYDVAHGLSPHMNVSTVAQANAMLAKQSNDHIPLPQVPGQLQSCCLHHLQGTIMTCAMIKDQGHLITIAMADSKKMRSPKGQIVQRDGRTFITHHVNGINMVMEDQIGRWLCVMGETPFEQLINVAIDIRTP